MKPSGIGGQAVIEGVMMKNKSDYAVAIRKPDGDIEVSKDIYLGISEKISIFRLPFLRGVAAFADSLILGMRTLNHSASYYDEDIAQVPDTKETVRDDSDNADNDDIGEITVREWKDPNDNAQDKGKSKTIVKEGLNKSADNDKKDSVAMALTMVLSVILAVGIFVVLPFVLSELFSSKITSYGIRSLIEGVIRLILFILYIKAITLMQDIKRVFMYHGAEHKVINCIERGKELTVENAKKAGKEHKRCGTSFLLYVVLISIVLFVFIRVDQVWLRMLLRIVLVPVIAGIAYEFIRLAGRTDNPVINILSKPGLWLQGLTTKEPDDDMLEVAIASVEAVFDWKNYQESGDRYNSRNRRNTIEIEDDTAVSTSALGDEGSDTSIADEADDILNALDRFFVMDEDDDDKP